MEIPSALKQFTGDLKDTSPEIREDILKIVGKFISLGFLASFKKVDIGPVVKTYFFEPHMGAPLSKVIGKEEDIALSLGVEAVLISRELQYITIAVPNKKRVLIEFKNSLFKLLNHADSMILPILLGQNPKGEEIYADIAEQPHVLIAGATNSGKSVFISQLIASLALFSTPDELELTLVDTKQLDLVLFSGLAHAKVVIKDIHDFRAKLAVEMIEVRRRMALMSGLARNLREYNKMGFGNPIPYKIIIVDEFADIIGADESYLKTLAPRYRPDPIVKTVKEITQISRAAGVHLILATQRPSVKVIPGDLKTNFPCRICFKLPTMQDSRVVLDENGAERLLGKGDFLYKVMGSDTVKRGHSAFVSLDDISTIIDQSEFLRNQYVKKGN